MQPYLLLALLSAPVLAQLTAPVASVVEKPCPNATSDAVQCFVAKTDSTIRGDLRLVTGIRAVNVDKMAKCVKANADRCFSKATGTGMSNLMAFMKANQQEIKQCVEKVLPSVKSDMERCVRQKYEWFKMPALHPDQAQGMSSDHPGVNYMILDYIIREYTAQCKTLASCKPPNQDKIRTELCKHQHSCFDQTEERCGEISDDLQATVCDCWTNLPGKDEAINEMSTCIATRAGMPAEFSGVMKKFIVNAVNKKVCDMDMDAYFDQCGSETASSSSSSSGGMLGALGGGNLGGKFGDLLGG